MEYGVLPNIMKIPANDLNTSLLSRNILDLIYINLRYHVRVISYDKNSLLWRCIWNVWSVSFNDKCLCGHDMTKKSQPPALSSYRLKVMSVTIF